jgi:hypothetical protein
MKNKFFAFAFLLIGTFAFANIENSEELKCTSTTTTTTNTDGSSTTNTTTNISCDTALELAQFHAEIQRLTQ